MSKRRLKLMIWAVLVFFALMLVLWTIQSTASLVAYFQQGADPAAALNLVPNVPLDLKVALAWLPDDEDTGRDMEPLTRTQVESAYLRAWLQWNLSYRKGEPYGLKSYFVGPALDAITGAVTRAALAGWDVSQVDTSHHLKLHFYAADGSIVSFTDENAEVAQVITDEAGTSLFAGESKASYDVVMFLEDGNWRVRHWVRRPSRQTETAVESSTPLSDFVQVKDDQLVLNGEPFIVAGVNYYPQQTPWLDFWREYDPDVTQQDLALIRSLGMNTVRIFVPFELFGGAEVDTRQLAKLEDFLEQAQDQKLKVIVTLFDFRTDYTLLDWPAADRHLETLLEAFKEHPAILAWDLKNEPDLDYTANGREVTDAWLTHILSEARRQDPNHLLTIGWSTAEAATGMAKKLDLISYHDFKSQEGFKKRYDSLRTEVGHVPILLSEFGMSTGGRMLPGGHSEADQAAYYSAAIEAIHDTDMAGALSWTLYDFDSIPTYVSGLAPWRKLVQRRYGLIRLNGNPKPAAKVFSEQLPAKPVADK